MFARDLLLRPQASAVPSESQSYEYESCQFCRVIALILVNIVPGLDIEELELASVRRYPSEGQYSPISVQSLFYYIAINSFARLNALYM